MEKPTSQFRKGYYTKHFNYSHKYIPRRLTMDSAKIIKFSRESIINNVSHFTKIPKKSIMSPRAVESTIISTEASSDQFIMTDKNLAEENCFIKQSQAEVQDFLCTKLHEIAEENINLKEFINPITIGQPLKKQRNSYCRQAATKTVNCSPISFLKPSTKEIREYQKSLKTN